MRRLAFAVVLVGFLAPPAVAQQANLYDLYQKRELQACLDAALPRLAENPDDRDLNQLIGRCLVEIGRVGEARPYLEKVIKGPGPQDWRYAFAYASLATVTWWEGDRERARAMWTTMATDPKLSGVAQTATIALAMTGQGEDYALWPTIAGEHVHCRFWPRLTTEQQQAFVREADATWSRLAAFFGGAPDRAAEVLIWPDAATAKQVAGVPVLGYAFAQMWVAHSQLDLPLGRALAPIFLEWVVRPQNLSQFVAYGVAEICDGREGVDRTAEARAALAATPDATLDIPRWWQDDRAIDWRLVRPVAGGMLQALLDHGGQETFREFLREPTYVRAREIYGKEQLEALLAEFMAAMLPH
jgi:hypothetical protein